MRIGRLRTGQKVSKDWLLKHGWISVGGFVGGFVGRFIRDSGTVIESFEKPSKAKIKIVEGEKETYIPILELNVRTGQIAMLATRIIFHDLKRVSKS